jgi:predicted RNase H-like HicB family nuclease
MTWGEYHKKSEQLAGEAEVAYYKGEADLAQELYCQAAELEEKALSVLDRQKTKTLGITSVSATALWYKAGQYQQARKVAEQWLASGSLPAFAMNQLDELLRKLPPKTSFSMKTTDEDLIDVRELGRYVKRKREAERLSLRGVAKLTGISPSTLSRIETARGFIPDAPTLARLTQWLQIPIERIVGLANRITESVPFVYPIERFPDKTLMNRYQIIISWDDESGTFTAEAPELPGCIADGVTRQEAVTQLETIIAEWIETAKELNRPIPQPRERRAAIQ